MFKYEQMFITAGPGPAGRRCALEALNETTVKDYLVQRGLAERLGGGPRRCAAPPACA